MLSAKKMTARNDDVIRYMKSTVGNYAKKQIPELFNCRHTRHTDSNNVKDVGVISSFQDVLLSCVGSIFYVPS